ncbi:MAG: MOSC N-terminal beta barrel domain-containing protein [Pseudomonadota bacterium]
MPIRLDSVHIYPVKSARGCSVPQVAFDRFGPTGDRRWMLVGADTDRFVSQRELPAMARLAVSLTGAGLSLSFEDASQDVSRPEVDAPVRRVTVWNDTLPALDAGDEVASWLSARFDRPVRLVYMGDDTRRAVDEAYAKAGQTVSFADGFPVLLISAESLAVLNERLTIPVGLDRFRANLIVSGTSPHGEDEWRTIRIGEMHFTVAKPCSRCTVPALDQHTGERHPELLRALASYRRGADRMVYFGQNLVYEGSGGVSVGDDVEVLS